MVKNKMKRLISFMPELLVFGSGLAAFRFLIRSNKQLNPQKTWNFITKPGSLRKWFEDNYPPKIFLRLLRFYYRNTFMFKNHSYGIARHYDISNDFYKLFLDKKYMFYSCADFSRKNESLEEAQENKADYLIKLIDPKPREKILDLGCGWGGMLNEIYKVTGNKRNLIGYTLSKEQKKYIEEKYAFNIELRDYITTEYRENYFDKIFSIESLEHVREKELLPLAQKLRKAIKPSGIIVHQFCCQRNEFPHPAVLGGGFDIFPGSEYSSLKKHLDVFEQAKFRVVHCSIHDDRPTLESWFRRLVENKHKAIELVGVGNYNKYLCFFAGIWRLCDEQNLLIMRVVVEPN